MSFEAANRTLGEVFNGGSHCEIELICRRILQRRKLADVEIHDNKLKKLCYKIIGVVVDDPLSVSDEMIETAALKAGRQQYKEAIFSNRQQLKDMYLDSTAYKRSKHGNCFVWYQENGDQRFGQIQYFPRLSGPPFYDELQANVKLFEISQDIGLVKGYIFIARETEEENLVPVLSLTKLFCYRELNNPEVSYLVKLCNSFDHS